MRLARPILAATAYCMMAAAVPAQAAALLAPHRAVYDLALEDASDRSGITGLKGRMVYEFNGSPCEGYTVKFRFVTRIDTRDASRLTDQQTTTFEDGEGTSFDFVTRSFVDRSPDKEVKGRALLEPGGLSVALDKPLPTTLELERTQFPTQHLLELIGKARKGETFYETNLFDGSEEADRVMTTTVVIGKEELPAQSSAESAALDGLSADPYWPVDIAYFDLTKADATGEEVPEYRISFKLHENGVTHDLMMDYGDFSMKGKLVNLALFEQPKDCPR